MSNRSDSDTAFTPALKWSSSKFTSASNVESSTLFGTLKLISRSRVSLPITAKRIFFFLSASVTSLATSQEFSLSLYVGHLSFESYSGTLPIDILKQVLSVLSIFSRNVPSKPSAIYAMPPSMSE